MNLRHLPPHIIKQERERRALKAWRARLGRGRYADLVKEIAELIRHSFEAGDISSPFGLEGALWHSIRGDLCLQGWRWLDADRMAREMLSDAFSALKVERPDWKEGQLEWTIEAGTLIERTRCMRCHVPLPEGHYKFCSNLCGTNHSRTLSRQRQEYEDLSTQVIQLRLT